MHTPVALLLDYYSGWSFPRHLYTDKVYRVWGNLPYAPGDYFTDAVLDLLYPGYANSSYYHDESGFIAPTPYGDIADCLLTDAPLWALERYAVVVVAGELRGGREVRDNLQAYLERGGQVVITAGNLARLPGGLGGRTEVTRDDVLPVGRGQLTLLASSFGVEPEKPTPAIRSENDRPLPKPYRMEAGVRQQLDRLFKAQRLVSVEGEGLSYITCRRGAGELVVGIANNTWREQAFRIVSRCGELRSVRELPLDQSEQGAEGYAPEGLDVGKVGRNTDNVIAGGDVRVFALQIRETGIEEIAHIAPPPRPKDVLLPVRQAASLKAEILARPGFFEHFGGVVVDWRYLHDREAGALRAESGWLKRQGLRVVVDLSSGINLYPGLRLMDNLHADYEASLAMVTNVLAKMDILGARDLILTLHRFPENNFTDEQSRTALEATLKTLAGKAAEHQITLHLRLAFGKPPWSLQEAAQWLDRVGAPNLKLAPSTALLAAAGTKSADASRWLKDRLGLWLVSGYRKDLADQVWDVHAPLDGNIGAEVLTGYLAASARVSLVLDANYADQDAEYADATALKRLLPAGTAEAK
jgi:hypothetical protein